MTRKGWRALMTDAVAACVVGYFGAWWLGLLVPVYGLWNFHDGWTRAKTR